MESTTRTYQGDGEVRRGVESMGRAGWRVVSQSSYTPRKGCLRTLAGGFLFFNRKAQTVVTYQKE